MISAPGGGAGNGRQSNGGYPAKQLPAFGQPVTRITQKLIVINFRNTHHFGSTR
jgi:hypothetical protein